MNDSRRGVLRKAAVAGGVLALGGLSTGSATAQPECEGGQRHAMEAHNRNAVRHFRADRLDQRDKQLGQSEKNQQKNIDCFNDEVPGEGH